MLHVNPEHLIIGNGATELIVLINTTLIDRIAVPVPTFGEYIEKLKDQRDAELFTLRPEENYNSILKAYLAWVRRRGLKALLVINPGNPTGQLFSLDEMIDFLHRAKDMELVIVDESFIDFAGDPIPSLLQRGRPILQSVAGAQHEQALRRAGLAPGILLQRKSFRSEPHAAIHSHLECEYAGAIFSVLAASHRRGLSRSREYA